MDAVDMRVVGQTSVQANATEHLRGQYIDATMTRAVREVRIAWRLEHLDEWRRDLENLAHFSTPTNRTV